MQKVFWTSRARGLLRWCEVGLHRCKRGFGWCKRLLDDLCSLGPKESKRPCAPSPNHFWRLSPFGQFPRSTASQTQAIFPHRFSFSGRKNSQKMKFLGRIFMGQQGPTHWDISDPGPGMSLTKTLCKARFSVVLDSESPGTPFDLGRDVLGSENLYDKKTLS